ncbi:MAG: DoxX family protein [Nakamurella sp.]
MSSRRTRAWDLVGLVARLVLAAVFIGFGWVKATESPAEMRVAVQAYHLVPPALVDVVAAILPYLEIATGFLLLLGLATRIGAALTTVMMVGFLFGLGWVVAKGYSIDCGCSGGGGAVAAGDTHYTEEILRDVGLLILSAYLLFRPRSALSVDGLTRRADADQEGDEYDDDLGHPAAVHNSEDV